MSRPPIQVPISEGDEACGARCQIE